MKAEKLNVFFEEHKVGEVKRDEELVYTFSYEETWLNFSGSFPLSLAMPLQKESFGNRITLSFFENLLPEGEAREALEKSQSVKGEFEFLKEFGSDCAGAIIITESEKSPYQKTKSAKEIRLEIEKINEAIDNKRSVAEVIAKTNPGYLSIAGAQDKFPAIYKEGEFFLPTDGRPTTHIVKVPIFRSGVVESVYNEYFSMQLAKKVGLTIPHCLIVDHQHHPLYVIERYDRYLGEDKKLHRYHQQDFCQAQGHVSESKYEEKGGPSIKSNYELIMKNVTIKKRKQATLDYLDWICFNFLLGNNDSHSKNISFLQKEGKIELAPFYDILCTAVYPKIRKYFSFFIGGRNDYSKIGKKQLHSLERELGLKEGVMVETMINMKEKLLAEKEKMVKEFSKKYPHSKIAGKISSIIQKRCKSLNQQGM